MFSLFPEAKCNVLEVAFIGAAIEALIGGGFLQGTQMFDEGPDLDVVKVLFVDEGGDNGAATVPCDAQLWIFLMDVLREMINAAGIVVATHEGNAGEVRAVFLHEVVDGCCGQWQADIFPEIVTVTPRTMTRAITDVNCQCHFVGYLLKYYSGIDVLQHSGLVCHGVVTASGFFLTGL